MREAWASSLILRSFWYWTTPKRRNNPIDWKRMKHVDDNAASARRIVLRVMSLGQTAHQHSKREKSDVHARLDRWRRFEPFELRRKRPESNISKEDPRHHVCDPAKERVQRSKPWHISIVKPNQGNCADGIQEDIVRKRQKAKLGSEESSSF